MINIQKKYFMLTCTKTSYLISTIKLKVKKAYYTYKNKNKAY